MLTHVRKKTKTILEYLEKPFEFGTHETHKTTLISRKFKLWLKVRLAS